LGVFGVVMVEAVVNRRGVVTDARVAKSIPLLDDAALTIVRRNTFPLTVVDDRPADVRISVPVVFRPSLAPVDEIDIARFLYERGEYAATEAVLSHVSDEIVRLEITGTPVAAWPGADALAIKDPKVAIMPTVVKEVRPRYTPEAMRARTQGTVLMEAVVLTDGTVGSVRILKGLPNGLSQEAVDAARQWMFTPARDANGAPLAVIVTLSLSFSIFARQ
jgi:protein TonB